MSEPERESRPAKRGGGGTSPARFLYGALLVLIGGCLGIVIGSVSETPRILFERLRGPVQTVDLEPPPPPPAAAPAAPPLEAFGELQGQAAAAAPKPKAEPARPAAKAEPKPEPKAEPKAPAPAPAVSSAPPPAPAKSPAKSPEEIVRELEKKTPPPGAPPAAAAPAASTVVQVLSLADKKQAEALIAKLRAQGFEPYASPMPDKSGRLRVRVRPKGGETTAALETRLRELGFKTWITAE